MQVTSLNILRIALILVVFACHSSDFLPEFIDYYVGTLTGYALQLFFIISGFCCALSALRKPPQKTLPYFWARLKKMYPMHFIAFLMALALLIVTSQELDWGSIIKQSIFCLTLTQAWGQTPEVVYSINGVAWFLSALMFCYLLTPLLVRLLKKYARYAIWIGIALIAVRLAYVDLFIYWDFSGGMFFTNVAPPFRFVEYAVGACFAPEYIRRRKQGAIPQSSFVQLASLIVFMVVFYASKNQLGFTRYFIFVDIFLFYSLVFYEGILSRIGSNRVIARMAAEIMPFFLTHTIILRTIRFCFGQPDSVARPLYSFALWLLALGIAMAVSRLYYYVEGTIKKKHCGKASR